MTTCILQSSLSPTQERAGRYESGLITSIIMDDNENGFPIQIEYVYHKKNGVTVVYTHDYKLCPDAKICQGDIKCFCEEEIKKEHRLVEFF